MYGCTVTKQGLALIANVIASKEPLVITRVMMGSGEPEEGVYIGDLEDLIEPVVAGTVSEPLCEGSTVSMTVEYRSDLNGGLKEGFIIREFGVFAQDGDGEILLYYGCLAEYPQYIAPWNGNSLDIRRYPISITVAEGTEVKLEGLPGTVMTVDDVKDYCMTTLLPQLLTASHNQIVEHNRDTNAHPNLRQEIADAKLEIAAVQVAVTTAQQTAETAQQAAQTAQAAADSAVTAAENSAGGCAIDLTFAEGTAGQTYTVTGGNGEVYTGTIPESLTVTVSAKECDATYTVTSTAEDGTTYTNTITTGPYFGKVTAEVTDFTATLTVQTSPGAAVAAACGSQTYTATAGEDGGAVLTICATGTYTVTASLEGKTARGVISITESGQEYAMTLSGLQADLNTAPVARYYKLFEPEDWTAVEEAAGGGFELRIPQTTHGMDPKQDACCHTLRHRIQRTALDYTTATANQGREGISAAMAAALSANSAAEGTYPTAEDGHVQLTWAQVQYYLLEQTMVSADAAEAKAAEKGFNWQDRDITGAPETAALDAVLTAAYTPALGGSSAVLDNLCTAEVLQGLRLRRKDTTEVETITKYDLDGIFVSNTWGVLESRVFWDIGTKALVVRSDTAYAGDLLVMA